MTRTKKSPVVIVTPVDELPDLPRALGNCTPAPHWQAVADSVKEAPGQWCIVALKGYKEATLRSAVARIKNATAGKDVISSQLLMSFAEPGFDAAWREGKLYVRYDEPAVTSINKRRRGAA